MNDSEQLDHKIKHRSLFSRYITMAVLLGAIGVMAASYGYFDMTSKSSQLVQKTQEISNLLEMTTEIRNQLGLATRSLETFMLEAERDEQKIIFQQSISKALLIAESLNRNSAFINTGNSKNILNIIRNISRFKTTADELFKVRVNPEIQYPALGVATYELQPTSQIILSTFAIAINEFHEDDNLSTESPQLHSLLEGQLSWWKTIAEFRLYLANRTGGFNSKGLIIQETNIDAYLKRLHIIAEKLDEFNQASLFGIEGEELIHDLHDHIRSWEQSFLRVKKINHSGNWRKDSDLMRNVALPLIAIIDESINELDYYLEQKSSSTLELLQHAGDKQNYVIAGMIFLFALYVFISLSIQKMFIIKPIATMAKVMKDEAFGLSNIGVLKLKKTLETQDLIEAFTEMSHQVYQRQNELEHQSQHDALTGLPNRSMMMDRMKYHQSLRARDKMKIFSFLMLDLNRFKDINDTLGHHIGDHLLIEVGKRLSALLRDSDTVARLGGDEFAILLPDTEKTGAGKIATNINSALEETFNIHQYSLNIAASIGIAMFPNDGENSQAIMQHADVAMYVSKHQNTGYHFYDSNEDTHTIGRLSLGNELPTAIQNNNLNLYYQPKLSMETGMVIGAEALLRWNHPEHGFISPEIIIDLAEHTGVINELTYWVMLQAVELASQFFRDGKNINIAINLSVHNLRETNFPERVLTILKKYKLPSRCITFEITESAMMSNPEQSIEVLNTLNDMGVSLSVDDFGTGFSSLAYLKQLPVTELKIDKSFVLDMLKDESDAVIVRSTIDLSHNLGLSVIAEGVENEETWTQLLAMGCDYAQGYYMSHPLPQSEFITWLNKKALS